MVDVRPSRGFTALEFLIVLAIVAIGTAASAPSLNALINERRAEVAATQLLAAIRMARGEAVKRAAMVVVRPVTNGGGIKDWVVRTEADRDPTTRQSTDTDLRLFPVPASTRLTGDDAGAGVAMALLAFDVMGRNVAVASQGAPESRVLRLCNARAAIEVTISAMGSATYRAMTGDDC